MLYGCTLGNKGVALETSGLSHKLGEGEIPYLRTRRAKSGGRIEQHAKGAGKGALVICDKAEGC